MTTRYLILQGSNWCIWLVAPAKPLWGKFYGWRLPSLKKSWKQHQESRNIDHLVVDCSLDCRCFANEPKPPIHQKVTPVTPIRCTWNGIIDRNKHWVEIGAMCWRRERGQQFCQSQSHNGYSVMSYWSGFGFGRQHLISKKRWLKGKPYFWPSLSSWDLNCHVSVQASLTFL